MVFFTPHNAMGGMLFGFGCFYFFPCYFFLNIFGWFDFTRAYKWCLQWFNVCVDKMCLQSLWTHQTKHNMVAYNVLIAFMPLILITCQLRWCPRAIDCLYIIAVFLALDPLSTKTISNRFNHVLNNSYCLSMLFTIQSCCV